MQKVAELSEADIKLAIELWMYNKHNATVPSGGAITFCYKDGPGWSDAISARVEYFDSPKVT